MLNEGYQWVSWCHIFCQHQSTSTCWNSSTHYRQIFFTLWEKAHQDTKIATNYKYTRSQQSKSTSTNSSQYLKEVIAGPYVAFKCRSTREIPGPKLMCLWRIGEEVILFVCVGVVGSIHRVQVARRSWIEQVHFIASSCLLDSNSATETV